jgi:hypothetical protein
MCNTVYKVGKSELQNPETEMLAIFFIFQILQVLFKCLT